MKALGGRVDPMKVSLVPVLNLICVTLGVEALPTVTSVVRGDVLLSWFVSRTRGAGLGLVTFTADTLETGEETVMSVM